MPRVINANTTAETPVDILQEKISALKPGEKVSCPNSREEILATQHNLMRRRAEIPGADSHLQYIEELLLAEARGKLQFRS